MASCTFRGNTIVTSATGCWTFTRGVFDRAIGFENAPRAFGDFAKDLHMAGAVHTLDVTFINVASSAVPTLFSTIDGLYNPSAASITSGALVVHDMFGNTLASIQHCVMLPPEPGAQEPRVKSITPTNAAGDGTAYWNVSFTLKFRQTRR